MTWCASLASLTQLPAQATAQASQSLWTWWVVRVLAFGTLQQCQQNAAGMQGCLGQPGSNDLRGAVHMTAPETTACMLSLAVAKFIFRV